MVAEYFDGPISRRKTRRTAGAPVTAAIDAS